MLAYCGRLNNGNLPLPEDVYVPISRTYYLTAEKGLCKGDEDIFLDYPGGPKVITRVLFNWRQEAQRSRRDGNGSKKLESCEEEVMH